MAAPTCPTCEKPLPEDKRPEFPFCSERCRTIDLGRWLNGDYRIPIAHADEDEDGAAVPEPAPRRPFDA
jgi:hypothetical protein